MSVGELHDVPSKASAFPLSSNAIQKVFFTHDTASSATPGSMDTAWNHEP